MAISVSDQYPGKTKVPDANYPFGSAQNITTPGDGTGMPWEKAWVDDVIGLMSSILDDVGVIPNGNPDTVLVAQYRDALKKSRGYVDVKAFGAVGDGVADDTAAIQATIDFVAALGGGGVLFKAGTYLTSKIILTNNLTLFSVGAVLKLKNASDSALIEIPIGSFNVVLDHIEIDGNSVNNIGTPATVGLISILSTDVAPTKDVWIEKCLIKDAHQNGIFLNDGCERIHILNCLIDGADQGSCIFMSPSTGTVKQLSIVGNTCLDSLEPQIHAQGNHLGVVIANNYCDGTSSSATSPNIRVIDQGNECVLIDGNELLNSNQHGVSAGGLGVTVSNNIIREFNDTGIVLSNGDGSSLEIGVVIGNNIFGGASAKNGIVASDAPGASITGNTCEQGSLDGIRFQNTMAADSANRFSISGNCVKDYDQYGIVIIGGSGVKDGVIAGCSVIGTGVATTVSGVRLQDCEDCVVNSCRVGDCATGLHEIAPSNFNNFVGSVIRGNTTPKTIVGGGSQANSNL